MKRELCEFRWLHIPYRDAAALLRERASDLIGPAADAGAERAREMLSLEAEIAGRRLERPVQLDLGDAHEATGPFPIFRLPMAWRAAEHEGLFPVMEGQLEAYPIDPGRTQISFQGTYEPPFGLVGNALDAMFLHRVAEESVQRFLRTVAQRLRHAWLAGRGPARPEHATGTRNDPAEAGSSG